MQSTAVSTVNGRSCNMLKVGSKRRRTKAEIKADKSIQEATSESMKQAVAKLQKVTEQYKKERDTHSPELAKVKDKLEKTEKLERDL